MIGFGILSVVFDLALIVILLEVYRVGVAQFLTAWFIESACSEMAVTFAIRTRRRFYRSRPASVLVWSSALAALVAFGLPFTAIGQQYFEFVPLSSAIVMLIVAILVAYFLAAELAKIPFFRRFDT